MPVGLYFWPQLPRYTCTCYIFCLCLRAWLWLWLWADLWLLTNCGTSHFLYQLYILYIIIVSFLANDLCTDFQSKNMVYCFSGLWRWSEHSIHVCHLPVIKFAWRRYWILYIHSIPSFVDFSFFPSTLQFYIQAESLVQEVTISLPCLT